MDLPDLFVVSRCVHVREQTSIRIERLKLIGADFEYLQRGNRLADAEISHCDPIVQMRCHSARI